MNEHEIIESDKDEDDDTELTDTTTLSANVGETSVEINVQDLIAEIEAEATESGDGQAEVRRKLEALLERKNTEKEFEDFEDYDLDS